MYAANLPTKPCKKMRVALCKDIARLTGPYSPGYRVTLGMTIAEALLALAPTAAAKPAMRAAEPVPQSPVHDALRNQWQILWTSPQSPVHSNSQLHPALLGKAGSIRWLPRSELNPCGSTIRGRWFADAWRGARNIRRQVVARFGRSTDFYSWIK